MSGVDSSKPCVRNGIIAAKATIDGETRWCRVIQASGLSEQQNIYMQGNDERPMYYEFGETFYIVVSNGSYPVDTTIYFIREPKVLVASSVSGYQVTTCELNAVYHRLISEIAAANCWRMLGDESSLAKYDRMIARIEERIQAIVFGNVLPESTKQQEIE